MRRLAVPVAVGLLALLACHHSAAAADCTNAFDEYQDKGWLWMYLAAFGFGFLTSLTPCVYPMIPITLAIFGARGGDVSRKRAALLATVYVGGMGLTYAALGVTIALLGKTGSFGTQLGSAYVVVPICLLFAALAASLFGAFTLQLPSSVQNRLSNVGGKGFGGAFAMGLVGGLIAAPCTGPFLLGLLTFVATTHDVLGGGSLLFVYALGMGVLFWGLAAFAMALPKSGAWMEHGKSLGGVLLLFAAIYFVRPLVPALLDVASPELWFAATMTALVVVGLALGAVHRSFHGELAEKLRKGVGVALVVVGASGLWLWYDTPAHPLAWIDGDEQLAFDTARAQHKGVMVDFGAVWCGACHDIERTFGDKDVNEAITADFVPLHFDVTQQTDETEALQAKYGVATLPGVVFVTADRAELLTIRHEVSPSDMLARVRASARGLRGEIVAKCD